VKTSTFKERKAKNFFENKKKSQKYLLHRVANLLKSGKKKILKPYLI
jgi:hypothetical protein